MFRRWLYRLEKGHPHVIMLSVLLVVIVALSFIGGLLVHLLNNDGSTFAASVWWTFLHLSDPGYLGDNETTVSRVLGTIFITLGLITFVAGLVGILTSMISSTLERLRNAGAPLTFSDHTLVIGWNSRIYSLISELLRASNGEDIVVMGPLAKIDAEKELNKRVIQPLLESEGKKSVREVASRLVYRQGNPLIIEDMQRVNASVAGRFVLLAGDHDDIDGGHDVGRIRALDTIEALRGSGSSFTTVVELHADTLRAHAFYALKMDPRHDAFVTRYEEQLVRDGKESYLPKVKEADLANNLTVVNSSQIISRALVQCAIQPSLSLVMHELLSFTGKELFIWEPDEKVWGKRFEELHNLPAQERLSSLTHQLTGAIVVGTGQGETFSFSGEKLGKLDAKISIVLIGDKQTWKPNPSNRPYETITPSNIKITEEPLDKNFNVLILGCNSELDLVIGQLSEYANQYSAMQLSITLVSERRCLDSIDRPDLNINVVNGNYTQWATLGPILLATNYDAIMLLGDDLTVGAHEVDARVTLGLVMLRAYSEDPRWASQLANCHIVAEVRDPSNRSVLENEKLAGDVLVSDDYVSGFISQVCVDFRLEELFRELLDYEDFELYTRPLVSKSETTNFSDMVAAAAQRGEVAIGCLVNDRGRARSVLAPELMKAQPTATHVIVISDS